MHSRETFRTSPCALVWAISFALAGCGDDGDGAEASEAGSTSGDESTSDTPTTQPPTTDTPTTDTTSTTAADSSSSGEPDPGTTGGSSSTGEPEGTGSSSTGEGSSSESSSGGEQATIMLDATFMTYLGGPVDDGSICTADGCEDIIASAVEIEVLADADIDLWIEADGFPENHWQFSTGPIDETWSFISPTSDELLLVAGLVGATPQPGMGSIAQQVGTLDPLVPAIDDPGAEGPFFLELSGMPSKTHPIPSGFYLFFNVAPGPHAISLPGCDEGGGSWGPSSDESIDIDMTADGTVLLRTITCG